MKLDKCTPMAHMPKRCIMKKNDFKELLSSIDQARKIHKGRLRPGRVLKFNPVAVKNIRKKLHVAQSKFAYMKRFYFFAFFGKNAFACLMACSAASMFFSAPSFEKVLL